MLATVATLTTLTLVLPTFTTSAPGPQFSSTQLTFAAIASLALYALFVFVQTYRHRDSFVAELGEDETSDVDHAASTTREAIVSLALLVVALVGVVGLAKVESPSIGDAVDSIGAPQSAVGVAVALAMRFPTLMVTIISSLQP